MRDAGRSAKAGQTRMNEEPGKEMRYKVASFSDKMSREGMEGGRPGKKGGM